MYKVLKQSHVKDTILPQYIAGPHIHRITTIMHLNNAQLITSLHEEVLTSLHGEVITY